MCDTEDKKALLTAVRAVLGAYEGGAYGAPLAHAMRHLRQRYDVIASAEGLGGRLPNPAPVGRAGKPALSSGYRVSAVGPAGARLFDGPVVKGERAALDAWLVRRAAVTEPMSRATLYKVTKGGGKVVRVWMLDPDAIWVQLPGKGAL